MFCAVSSDCSSVTGMTSCIEIISGGPLTCQAPSTCLATNQCSGAEYCTSTNICLAAGIIQSEHNSEYQSFNFQFIVFPILIVNHLLSQLCAKKLFLVVLRLVSLPQVVLKFVLLVPFVIQQTYVKMVSFNYLM